MKNGNVSFLRKEEEETCYGKFTCYDVARRLFLSSIMLDKFVQICEIFLAYTVFTTRLRHQFSNVNKFRMQIK